jgi:hypothetical protein
MGHRDFTTTLVYADYAPSAHEAGWVEAAFAQESASAITAVSEIWARKSVSSAGLCGGWRE